MSIQSIALEKSINMLKGIGAQYKITTVDGEVYESPKPVKKRIRAERKFPHGMLKSHYVSHLEKMQPGDIASVPFGPFTAEQLRSGMTATAFSMWGHDSHISSINKADSVVEIMRTK